MRPGRLAALLVVVSLAGGLAGCLDELRPEVGDLVGAPCRDADSDGATDVRFGEDLLGGLFARSSTGCLSCHDPREPGAVGVELGGLDLSSYGGLVRGGANSGEDIVVDGRPCESVLYLKLTEAVPFGSRMPANGPPFLGEGELLVVHDWISEGARDN